MYYTFAYITGSLIILFALLTFIFPKRKLTLIFKAALDFTAIFNHVFIYLITENPIIFASVATNIIGVTRDVVYYFRNKYKALNHVAWPIGFATINLLSLIITYTSPLSLVPVIGSVISSLTLFNNDVKVSKIGGLVSGACYLAYYAILIPSSNVLTIFSLINSAAGIVSTIIGLTILYIRYEKENKE